MSQFFEPRGTRGCVFIVSYTKTSYRRFPKSHSFLTLQNYTVNITLAYSFIPHHSLRMSHYVNLNLPAPSPLQYKKVQEPSTCMSPPFSATSLAPLPLPIGCLSPPPPTRHLLVPFSPGHPSLKCCHRPPHPPSDHSCQPATPQRLTGLPRHLELLYSTMYPFLSLIVLLMVGGEVVNISWSNSSRSECGEVWFSYIVTNKPASGYCRVEVR
jgi:hypothetical protein